MAYRKYSKVSNAKKELFQSKLAKIEKNSLLECKHRCLHSNKNSNWKLMFLFKFPTERSIVFYLDYKRCLHSNNFSIFFEHNLTASRTDLRK